MPVTEPAGPVSTVAVLDFTGSVQALRTLQELLAGYRVEVLPAGSVPRGAGIVALVLGPESQLSAADIAALPDLRIVATTSTGYDHVPVDTVAAQGCWVTHVADYCTDEVADHTVALIAGLLRGIVRFDRAVRRNQWAEQSPPPRRMAGTRVGLVGFGRTARAVTKRLQRLQVDVSVHAPGTPADQLHSANVRVAPRLTDLLSGADVVSLHLPLTERSRHLIDAAALAQLSPDAFLVNVSRGGLVDQAALSAALRSGALAGAALDVLALEPPDADDPLLQLDNVVLTPHVAWESPESQAALYVRAASSVATALAGGEPADVIRHPAVRTPERGWTPLP